MIPENPSDTNTQFAAKWTPKNYLMHHSRRGRRRRGGGLGGGGAAGALVRPFTVEDREAVLGDGLETERNRPQERPENIVVVKRRVEVGELEDDEETALSSASG